MRIVLELLIPIIFLLALIDRPAFAEKKMIKEYGFVILVDDECTQKAESINSIIDDMLPDLHNPANIWHITLHQGAYSETYLNEFKSSLHTLSLSPLNLYFTNIEAIENRWINFNIKKNPSLTKLHNKLVAFADRYFQRAIVRAYDVYPTLSDKKKAQVDNHGTYGVLEDYRPHMTLFYQDPPSPRLADVVKEVSKTVKPMKCKARELAIAELEYNGNISKIIYSVNFP